MTTPTQDEFGADFRRIDMRHDAAIASLPPAAALARAQKEIRLLRVARDKYRRQAHALRAQVRLSCQQVVMWGMCGDSKIKMRRQSRSVFYRVFAFLFLCLFVCLFVLFLCCVLSNVVFASLFSRQRNGETYRKIIKN